jgi:Rad51
LKFQTQNLLAVPKFKTALEYRDKFTFGHEKIDSILDLHQDDMIGIFGETRYTNALVTRLVVRSLLPRNHGGINAENVIVIDADNSSSPYLYVNYAREYGMHHSSVLEKVLVSRQFTIYQLTKS